MKVILLSDQRQTGRRGEIVKVRPGYARNFLFPQRLAVPATHSNLSWYGQQKNKLEAKQAAERGAAVGIAAQIEGAKVQVRKRAAENDTLYGSVTPGEVAEALAAKGHQVDRRDLDLAGGIKTLGDHQVRVVFHADVVAHITVQVLPEE